MRQLFAFVDTLKAWQWWRKNHAEREYTLMSQEQARQLVWIIFERDGVRINYCVDPRSDQINLPLAELILRARARYQAAVGAENERANARG